VTITVSCCACGFVAGLVDSCAKLALAQTARANNLLLAFTLMDFRSDQKVDFLENPKGIVIPLSAAMERSSATVSTALRGICFPSPAEKQVPARAKQIVQVAAASRRSQR